MWDNKWGQSTTRRWIFFPLKNIKYSASLNLLLLSIFVHFNGFYEIQEEVEKSCCIIIVTSCDKGKKLRKIIS